MNKPKLKTCPLCDGEASFGRVYFDDYERTFRTPRYFVGCPVCGFELTRIRLKDAVTAWNTRKGESDE